jgi:hypothetical protein
VSEETDYDLAVLERSNELAEKAAVLLDEADQASALAQSEMERQKQLLAAVEHSNHAADMALTRATVLRKDAERLIADAKALFAMPTSLPRIEEES